ncbi:Mov34/MPN/PAD-1 family protein [Amphiplicatus metriothermophilus]|uniref:JAB domain-containing protein n=1 Tax=Amphiplicatus metriothermophilus TaxID=1519374 RepID=A0A239PQD1_9PROT|nr:Mov34/MPN/PAD-1 family protein [Amphiplicatus metriothermophilus]MBB5518910.1 proteasome lid subunit RPN8/RPN11 [Amphiplicatus metriothermophilus]SNT71937.1 JAB domain-containing protein [Amphiplicatus metriothermophilus]
MTDTLLLLTPDLHAALWAHLLPEDNHREQAAFLFCRSKAEGGCVALEAIEAAFLKAADFAAQYSDYIELTDECRIGLIKRAHGLGAALAEFHSHPGPWPAAFSPSDRRGLRETVPHMRWRLPGRPYLAVVVAPSGFDALLWSDGEKVPWPLAGIRVAGRVHTPTNASLEGWTNADARPL